MTPRLALDVIGVPFDLCGKVAGSRLGPAALRMRQIDAELEALGHIVEDRGDCIPLGFQIHGDSEWRFIQALAAMAGTKREVSASIERGSVPIVLGGDHSLSIGSVSGALAALGEEPMAVLWIDAHMDFNTPATSPSGNFHGMSLAALSRLPHGTGKKKAEAVWSTILEEVVPEKGLDPRLIGWIGLRDVDQGELDNFEQFGLATAWAMQDIDHIGLPGVLEQVDGWLRGADVKKVWISFDVDALDPVLAPGTGTAVRGGLTYREGHLLAELLHEILFDSHTPYDLVGIDLVEVNPMQDVRSSTAIAAVEWAGSLFGKRTMRYRR